MPFNKIQPQQIQMPTFFSESGNLVFTDNSTGMTVELNGDVQGRIDFSDGVTSKGAELITQSSGITIGGSGNSSISQSGSATLDGHYNVAIGGEAYNFNGGYNASFNTTSVSAGSNSKRNTIIGGNSVSIDPDVTGSVALLSAATSRTIDTDNKVYIAGQQGIEFTGPTEFNSAVYYRGSAEFDNTFGTKGAATFSGDSTMLGEIIMSGATNMTISGTATDIYSDQTTIHGPLDLGDGFAAASHNWITGGDYDSKTGFIVHHNAANYAGVTPQAGQTGSILIQVSGFRFEIAGTWRTDDHVLPYNGGA